MKFFDVKQIRASDKPALLLQNYFTHLHMAMKPTVSIKTAFLCIFYLLPNTLAVETSIDAPIESSIVNNASHTTSGIKNHCQEGLLKSM